MSPWPRELCQQDLQLLLVKWGNLYVSMTQRAMSAGDSASVSEMRKLVCLHDPESYVSRIFTFCQWNTRTCMSPWPRELCQQDLHLLSVKYKDLYVSMTQRAVSAWSSASVSEIQGLVCLHDPESCVSRIFSFCQWNTRTCMSPWPRELCQQDLHLLLVKYKDLYVSMTQRAVSAGSSASVSEIQGLVCLHDPESCVSRIFTFCQWNTRTCMSPWPRELCQHDLQLLLVKYKDLYVSMTQRAVSAGSSASVSEIQGLVCLHDPESCVSRIFHRNNLNVKLSRHFELIYVWFITTLCKGLFFKIIFISEDDAHVRFSVDQVIAHESEIVTQYIGENTIHIHLGFLQFKHCYELTFSIKDSLCEDIECDPLQNLHVKMEKYQPTEDGKCPFFNR